MQRFGLTIASKALKATAFRAPAVSFSAQRWMSTKFTESHEYIKLDGDIATVGITAHAADALGDIVYVDLPSVGSDLDAGDSFGAVESVKAASDVYSPCAGEVVDVNALLEDTPGKVNEAPMDDGWFMKIKLSDAGKSEFDGLMDEAAYTAHCDALE